jgi:hypothetical protein
MISSIVLFFRRVSCGEGPAVEAPRLEVPGCRGFVVDAVTGAFGAVVDAEAADDVG